MIRDEIRPFVREARERGARTSARARPASRRPRPRLTTVVFSKLNRLGNMAAYNPDGAEPAGTPGRDEGYLYWVGWLGHNTSQLFSSGDGNGFYRRVYLDDGLRAGQSRSSTNPHPAVEALTQLVTGFTDPVRDSSRWLC